MSKMSFRLAKALASGRTRKSAPLTRESILAGLLRKRAAAAQAGLAELESQLRSQIRWALPVRSADSSAGEIGGPAEPEAGVEHPLERGA